jgi:hypothetical protein
MKDAAAPLAILSALDTNGWTIVNRAVDVALLDRLRDGLEAACVRQRAVQVRNGVGDGTDGIAHHLPLEGAAFLELLELESVASLLARYFDGPYILNTFGGVLNRPTDDSYVARVHRDQRSFSGELHLMAQLLVMLDDFTLENGATYLLTGSHRRRDKPSDQEFFRDAARAVAPAGSIVVFDSNLWHAAGVNHSPAARRALTLAFTRPFIKQQLDYPRALGYDRADTFSPVLRQLLGYNARVPMSLDEWYQPPSNRLYRRDQG